MNEKEIMEKIYNLLMSVLQNEAPMLSGNLKSQIELVKVDEDSYTIAISPQFYDVARWKKDGVLHFTGNKNGKQSYAQWVNDLGGFATGNASKHFANRSCNNACIMVASEYGIQVINELEL